MTDAPKTFEEAMKAGFHALTDDERKALPGHLLDTRLAIVSPCTVQGAGAYCSETPCVGGVKYAIYCDNTGGCTRYVRMPC